MNTFHLDIVTPTKALDLGDVNYLRAPGVDGLFGVMSGHRDSVFAIDIGGVKVVRDGKELFFATGRGYAEVTGQKAQLLVESIEPADKIDVSRAESALKRAKERLASDEVGIDRQRAETALARAINRLEMGKRVPG
ncbi:MAG: ATP synthase F1 subunit epsilon [Candidatus Neomarinimicrobiota bacterium]